MEEFCQGETPWNLDLLWNTTVPRFNRCFQRTVPVWMPSLLLWIAAPIQVFAILGSSKSTIPRPIPHNLYNMSRLFTVLGIVGVNFIWFGYDLWFYVRPDVWHARISMADLTCSLLKVFSFILFAFLIYLHRMYGIHTSGLAFTYMFKSLVLSLPSVYMYVMFFGDEDALADEYRIGVRIWDPVELGLFATHFALLLVVFLLTCFADQKAADLNVGKKRRSLVEHSTKTENGGFDYLKPLMNGHVGTEDSSSEVQLSESPELKVSFLSLITYWWFNGLMSLGYKKSLTLDDLWQLNPDYSTAVVAPQFDRNWLAQKKYSSEVIARYLKTAESNGGIGDTGTLDSQLSSDRFGMDSKDKKKTPGTVRTLVRTFGGQFVVGAFLKLTHDLLSFVNPQLLKYFIGFISSPSDPVWHGYVIAALFFLVSMKQSLMINLYFHKMISIGMKIRTALISAIYRKSLSLSNGALRETTTGEIINLMSVDAQRFEFMIMYINLVWSIPMQISLTMYFLYRELGASVFAGFGVMVLMIPVNVWISKIQQGLQTKQMGQKDERVKFINEVLNGIRVIKLYGWELPFIGKIGAIRHKEIDHLERISYINAFTSIIWTFSPFLVSFVTFGVYIYSSDENVLDAKKAFVSLSLFELLRFPLTILPDMITNLVLTRVAVKRLNRFFNLGQLEKYVKRERSVEWAVEVQNGTFAWEGEVKKDGDDEKTPLKVELEAKPPVMKIVTLNGISIKVKKGSLVAIVGRVGSGKSSLLSAILGDLERLDGSVNIDPSESIAYVAQQAWIRNASLRENILFGSKYVKSRYDAVIDMCALKPDLAILPGGDQIEIGEKGINLSGGQKQRVAIARACYSDTSLVLLDDPLSAVDSHVAEHIFRRVMSNDNGYLRKRTRILVTNNISFLPEFDHIIVLSNGTVSESGSYRQLIENSGKFSEFITEHAYEKADDDNNLEDDEDSLGLSTSVRVRTLTASSDRHSINSTTNKLLQHSTSVTSDKFDNQKVEDEDEKLIGTESTATGHVKWSVYMDYFRSLTTLWLVILVVGYVGMQVASVWSNVWLALWSNDYKTNNRTIDGNGTVTDNGIDGRNYRLSIYGVLGTVQGLLFFIGALALVKGTVSSSIKLHSTLLDRIMRSPVQFFDTTPLGRIVNRFSKDIDTVDTTIPTTIDAWLICFLQVVATFVLISFQVPIFMAVAVPILLFYFYLQKYCVATSRQLKRLESVTRSPIYSHFGETLQGVTTIRAFSATARFITQSNERVDTNQRCYFPGFIFNRWLSLRLEFCGNLIVLFAALFSVIKREDFQNEPGFIGLIITYSLSVTGVLNWCVRMTSAMESNIVSVERIQEYCHNKTEQAWNREVNEDPKVEENWPQKGVIEFKNYSVRYREGLDLVLRGIDVKIDAGQKIGIVGRTGAGKSSLTLALFRILEAASGKIVIDGLDIDRIGLHELRSKLSIIPQDPVLFSGTIRSNLDPFDRYSDERLWQALELSHLKEYVAAQESGLDYTVAENGSNLSVGQRQLVCLGRALLRQTSILVLDEATAAIDLSTDAFIQQTIRQQFAGCTVLTIAHRLNTIIDSDRVLVLEQGKVAEFAAPADLLADRRSKFYSLAKDAGLV